MISEKQAEKIMLSEQAKSSCLAWKLLYWISGLFIGLGCILVVASNWENISISIKLSTNYCIWAGLLFGIYWSNKNKKKWLKEIFLTNSFLFVGATIALRMQIFSLDYDWQHFIRLWCLYSFPFVVFSKLIFLNLIWVYFLFSIIGISELIDYLDDFDDFIGIWIASIIVFGVFTYVFDKIYKFINKAIILPKALSVFSCNVMYIIALLGGAIIEVEDNDFINFYVFIFLGIRLFLSAHNKNIKAFIMNMHLLELYILFLLFNNFKDLFTSGIGLILGGILLLCIIFVLKKTTKIIKNLPVFNNNK